MELRLRRERPTVETWCSRGHCKDVASKEYYPRILKSPQKTLFHTQHQSLLSTAGGPLPSTKDIREHDTKCSHQGICCSTLPEILAACVYLPTYNCRLRSATGQVRRRATFRSTQRLRNVFYLCLSTIVGRR